MADSLSDADKIRNKRLAKLGNTTGQNKSAEGTSGEQVAAETVNDISSSPAATEAPKPRINISSSSDAPSDPNPFSQLGIKPAQDDTPKINITSQTLQAQPKLAEHGRSGSRAGESLEQWEDRHLSNIFRISLTQGSKDGSNRPLYYLAETQAELEESGRPMRLSTGLLDSVLVEAASNVHAKTTPLNYLLECWKRVSRQYKALRKNGEQDPKFQTIKEARRLCMSYCIFAATIPDMFGRDDDGTNPLAQHLLLDADEEHGIDYDFMTEAISRFPEDDSIKTALLEAIEHISRQLADMSMNDNFKPHISVLRTFVQYPALVSAITQSDKFLPSSVTAPELEKETLLGPFYAISPLQADVTRNYFSAPSTRDRAYIINSQRALRMTLQSHQMDLLEITNRIIKTGKESRERMLDWFARCCNLNHKRRAMHVDEKTVSSDSLMINITVCLDQLCEPFMDPTFAKVDRIELDYLRRNPRVDIKEETKINADQKAADEFYGNPAGGTNNFISEVFFLCMAAHHYGTEAANSTLNNLEKDLKRMKKHIDEVELEREKFLVDPARLRQFDAAVKKWKEQMEKGMCKKFALEGVLMDEQAQGRSAQFMRYVIVWLLRLVSPHHDFPQKPLRLPLPEDAPDTFKCLPEYFVEDVVSNFKFIVRNMPQLITSTQSDELIMLCITFLRNSDYIKNPYLKAGLITILFTGVWPTPYHRKGLLGDLLSGLPFANEHLLHALINFYIEAEATGGHNQFYDKFNMRYEIFQIIKCIWSNPIYQERLSEEAADNKDFFVRFVNLLMNDATFVLDESFNALKKIHELTEELRDAEDMEQEQRQAKEEARSDAEGKAKSYMQLMNETVAMLKLFTEALADSFTSPEVVNRLAAMLDHNLESLVGPKSRDLKVQNMQEYGFNPRALLSELVDVYLNLRSKEDFVVAVSRDGRSYKPAHFEQARLIMRKWGLKSSGEINAWVGLGEKIQKTQELEKEVEQELGEVPDEFLDPLLWHMMTDPVILPSSKTTVDRSTIQSHLLSDPHDPFNRVPLKIEDVLPDTDMRERMEAFIAEKKVKKLGESNIMDTSEG